jgi:hypothetical protein
MKKITDNRTGITMEIAVVTNRKEKPYAEEIIKTGGRGLKNRLENERQESLDIEKRNEQISQIKIGNVEEVQRVELFISSNRKEWRKQGRCNVLTGISKAQQAFNQLGRVCKANVCVSTDTKVKMFNCIKRIAILCRNLES